MFSPAIVFACSYLVSVEGGAIAVDVGMELEKLLQGFLHLSPDGLPLLPPEQRLPTARVAALELPPREYVCRYLATPGHTRGHVPYLHEPTRALFCGDALNRLRLMARPVTPDLPEATGSALRCLREHPEFICPGHRAPLTENVTKECQRLQNDLESGDRWPLLG